MEKSARPKEKITLEHICSLLEEILEQLKSSKTKSAKSKSGEPTAASRVFDSYAAAHVLRYKLEPNRNARSMSLCKAIVQRIGVDDAILTTYFYLKHSDAQYLRTKHDLGLLLKDCEKLNMERVTNTRISTAHARGQEEKDFAQQQLDRIERGEL